MSVGFTVLGQFTDIFSFQQFPYPPYVEDIFFTTLSSNFALLVVVAFIFSAGFFVKVLLACH